MPRIFPWARQRALPLCLAVVALSITGGAGLRAASPNAVVSIDNFTFSPATLTVSGGTKVVWTNHDDIPHQVMGADGPTRYKSAPLDTGDSFDFTFARPGTYHYFCTIHPKMQGTVIVQ